jgi:hypothetical protein
MLMTLERSTAARFRPSSVKAGKVLQSESGGPSAGFGIHEGQWRCLGARFQVRYRCTAMTGTFEQ